MPFSVKQIGDDVLMGQIKSVKAKLQKALPDKPANLVKYLGELEAEAKARAEYYAKRDGKAVKPVESPAPAPVKKEDPKPEVPKDKEPKDKGAP